MKIFIAAAALTLSLNVSAASPSANSRSQTEANGDDSGTTESGLEGEPSDQELGKSADSANSGKSEFAKIPDPSAPVILEDADFKEVAKELRCPTCTGLSVLESEASFSVQIKDQVREQMQLGKNKEQVLNFFVERYGPWILREPPAQGFSLLAWLVPIALLCFGPVVVWFAVWKRRVHISTQGVRANEPILAEMQERLRQMKEGGSK